MAVQPSQNIVEIVSSTLGGRTTGNTVANRSGNQPANGGPQGRVLPEPAEGYDPRAPRGTYVDISV